LISAEFNKDDGILRHIDTSNELLACGNTVIDAAVECVHQVMQTLVPDGRMLPLVFPSPARGTIEPTEDAAAGTAEQPPMDVDAPPKTTQLVEDRPIEEMLTA
jgi:hypothetical protein